MLGVYRFIDHVLQQAYIPAIPSPSVRLTNASDSLSVRPLLYKRSRNGNFFFSKGHNFFFPVFIDNAQYNFFPPPFLGRGSYQRIQYCHLSFANGVNAQNGCSTKPVSTFCCHRAVKFMFFYLVYGLVSVGARCA
jgi:hypothetical protein